MRSSRRSFLKCIAASSFFPAVAAAEMRRNNALVGTQLYGWGQYYQREGKNMSDHMDEILSAVRDCGYDYAEGFLDLSNPNANARFAKQLKSHGLQPVALYTGGRLHEEAAVEKTVEQITRAARIAGENGFQIINCNPDPIGREKSDQELTVQAQSLNRLGAELKKIGLKFGVHNHTPEMQNNAREFHHNFNATDRKLVGFCYDVHWVFRGGIKPPDALKQYGSRVISWHLRQSRDGIWWEDLSDGDVDYKWIAAYVNEHAL